MASKTDNILVDPESRLFYLSDDIDSTSIGKMCFNLLAIIKHDDKEEEKMRGYRRDPIHVYVNSFGGEAYDMWALIDIIEKSKTPIYTYCTGYAMSAAFKIFLAGHKRFASEHATFMYHQLSGYRQGKYQDLVEDRTELDWLNAAIESYVITHTKMTREAIDDIRTKKKDTYIHAREALELGIIDEII